MNRDEIHKVIEAFLISRGHLEPIELDEHDECVMLEGMVCAALELAPHLPEVVSSIKPILDRPDPAAHCLMLFSPLGRFKLRITKEGG